MKIGNLLAVLGLFAFMAIPAANAAELFSPDKDGGGNLTLGAMEKHHNVYAAGANVTINSETTGDLFAVGQNITVDGVVEQDVALAGETLALSGKVGGDARMAGRTVRVTSPINGDALLAGAQVFLSDKSQVSGDLLVAGAGVEVNSPVSGNVRIAGSNVVINSKISGNIWVKGSGTVVFGPLANVSGKVTVYGKNQPTIKDGAVIPNLDFQNIKTLAQGRDREDMGGRIAGLFVGSFMVKLLGYLLAILLLLYFVPKRVAHITQNISASLASNIGIGLVAIIVIPILVVLTFLTLVGFYIAMVLLVWFILAIFVANLLAIVFLGKWIIKLANKKEEVNLDWKVALVGIICFMVLAFVPIIGWLAMALLFLASFGAMLKYAKTAIDA